VAQLVEHHLAKVRVAGSSPVVRSSITDPLEDHKESLAGGKARVAAIGEALVLSHGCVSGVSRLL